MTPKHNNSFDFLRLVFALMVIITHSLVLSGEGEADLLARTTGGQISFSYLGVRGFFVISGFLIFKSLQRSAGMGDYLKKRVLRIFPALVTMLLLVTFIIGPVFTRVSMAEYFADDAPWRYIGSALRLPGFRKTAALPGLFAANPATNAVNGSLWTIWFELMFYMALITAFLFRKRTRLLAWLLPAAWGLLLVIFISAHQFLDRHIFPFTGMSAEVAVDLALFFASGTALSLVNWKDTGWRNGLLLAGMVIIFAGLMLHEFHYLRYVGLPLAILAAGHFYVPAFQQLRRLGEPSYGIYIYAFPIQQLIIQELHPAPLAITSLAIPLALAAGYLSWHLVEAPVLALKKTDKSHK